MIFVVERDVTVCHVTSGHAHVYGITSRQAIAEHVISGDVTSGTMESNQKPSLGLRHLRKKTLHEDMSKKPECPIPSCVPHVFLNLTLILWTMYHHMG